MDQEGVRIAPDNLIHHFAVQAAPQAGTDVVDEDCYLFPKVHVQTAITYIAALPVTRPVGFLDVLQVIVFTTLGQGRLGAL